jgi:hypothetical protein
MKKIFIIFFLFVIVLNTSISAETWSPHMGIMNWDSASAKCRSIGMRLPTLQELKAAYNSGITDSWEKGEFYWSSYSIDAETYTVLNVYDGRPYMYKRSADGRVRCRR